MSMTCLQVNGLYAPVAAPAQAGFFASGQTRSPKSREAGQQHKDRRSLRALDAH